MDWDCGYSPLLDGWVVEAVGSDGEVYVTQFYGPLAEQRAKEYAEAKMACESAGVDAAKHFHAVMKGMEKHGKSSAADHAKAQELAQRLRDWVHVKSRWPTRSLDDDLMAAIDFLAGFKGE